MKHHWRLSQTPHAGMECSRCGTLFVIMEGDEDVCIVITGENDERRPDVDKRILRELGHDLYEHEDVSR